jgi:hypothetical protein
LILFGVLMLIYNLGGLEDNFWSQVWQLWPILFVLIGLESLINKKEVFGPVFWVGLGSVLLLSNFGLLDWSAWDVLWRLWPLLIVAGGLEILFGRRSLWLSTLVVTLILAVLAVAVGMAGISPFSGKTETESISQPLSGASAGSITLNMATGDLNLAALAESGTLIEGKISEAGGKAARSKFEQRGDTAVYKLEHTSGVAIPFNRTWQWDLGLTPQVPLTLRISLGAGQMNLDWSGLLLDEGRVSEGVGDIRLQLPAAFEDSYAISVSQAIGDITVELPADAGVRLDVSRALTSFSAPSDFIQRGDYYYSPEYDQAKYRIEIEISQAIGNITVQYGD